MILECTVQQVDMSLKPLLRMMKILSADYTMSARWNLWSQFILGHSAVDYAIKIL